MTKFFRNVGAAVIAAIFGAVWGVGHFFPAAANNNSSRSDETPEVPLWVIPAQIALDDCQQLYGLDKSRPAGANAGNIYSGRLDRSGRSVPAADYRPGVDVYGNPVVPAHGDGPPPVEIDSLPELVAFDLVIDPLQYSVKAQNSGGKIISNSKVLYSPNAVDQHLQLLEKYRQAMQDSWTTLNVPSASIERDLRQWRSEHDILARSLQSQEKEAQDRIDQLQAATGGLAANSRQRRAFLDKKLAIEQEIYYSRRYLDQKRRITELAQLIANAESVLKQTLDSPSDPRQVLIHGLDELEKNPPRESVAPWAGTKDDLNRAVFETATPTGASSVTTLAKVVFDLQRNSVLINGREVDSGFAVAATSGCQPHLSRSSEPSPSRVEGRP